MLGDTIHPSQFGNERNGSVVSGGSPLKFPGTEDMNLTLPARLGLCAASPLGRILDKNGTRPPNFSDKGESAFGETLRLNSSTGDLGKTLNRMRKEYDSRLVRTQDVGCSSLNKHTRTAHVMELPKRLQHEEASHRLRAVVDLGLMGTGAGALAPFVAEKLSDKDAAVRRRAVWTLNRMSMPVIRPHLGTVAKKLRHSNPDVRALAANLLGSMSYGADQHAYHISVCLNDEDVTVRQEAIQALAKCGRAGSVPFVKQIGASLKDEDATVRRWACTALGKIGKPATSFIPDIVALLRDGDFRIRQAATTALQEIRRL